MAKESTNELVFNPKLGMITNLGDLEFQILSNTPYHFKIFNHSENNESVLIQILDKFLLHLDIIFLRESLLAALRETVTNAIKANTKRLFFKLEKADIDNANDYKEKMQNFKNAYISNREMYENQLESNNYFVVVSFIHSKDLLKIRILNNVSIASEEAIRIKNRIEKSKTYNDLSEAFLDLADDTEGAGLGLIMTFLMLKNDGVGENPFRFESMENKTMITFDVPVKLTRNNGQILKADKILKEIDQLPTFPKAIQDIQAAIDKPNSSIQDIAEMIKRDISLSANILRLSNSASFRRGNKVETLDRAIQLIGLKELQSLLYSLGTKQLLEDKFASFQFIWDKSNECAYYSKLIGQKMELSKGTMNSLVSAALLHDIGEIILLSIEKEKMTEIQTYSNSKELSSALSMEEASFGITHTKLGAMVSEKWEFPELFTRAMEYHHRPLLAEDIYRNIVYPIYLADMMIKINLTEAKVSEIPLEILQHCKFKSHSDFQSFRTRSQETFTKQ
jgi:HD-like signal output (HDOD) protein